MAREVKVTLATDHQEVIQVENDFELEPILLEDNDGWLHIPTAAGGEYAVPMRLVVAVVLNDKPKKARGRA